MNQRVKILLLSSNLWTMGEGMLGPLFAVFTQHIGGSVLDITWAWAAYLVFRGVSQIITGKYATDRRKQELMSVVGYFISALATFSYLLVSSQTSLLLVQTLLGIGTALSTPTWVSLYSKAEDRGRESLEWGVLFGNTDIITGIAIVVGGLVVVNYSFAHLFVLMGIIKALAALIQLRILTKDKA